MKYVLMGLLIFSLGIIGCNTSKSSTKKGAIDLSSDDWIVSRVLDKTSGTTDEMSFMKAYVLSFGEERMEMQLDVNACNAVYTRTKNTLTIENWACTKKCCDSKEGKSIRERLAGIFTAKMDEELLVLENEAKTLTFYFKKKAKTTLTLPIQKTQWVVLNATENGKPLRFPPKSKYVYAFDQWTMSVKLDVNRCNIGATFTESTITLDADQMPACTRACCDTKEAGKLLLDKEITYSIQSDTLILKSGNLEVVALDVEQFPVLANTKWEVKRIQTQAMDTIPEKPLYVGFALDKVHLQLEMNICNHNCSYTDREIVVPKIMPTCTRRCCDSKNARRFSEAFRAPVEYKLNEKQDTLWLMQGVFTYTLTPAQ